MFDVRLSVLARGTELPSCDCICVCVSMYADMLQRRHKLWTENKMRLPCVHVYAWMRASICKHVCLRACVSSASYVSVSHDQWVWLMLTKIRVLVICPVSCSALLNYSRPGKRLRTAIFSPRATLSLPPSFLLCFVSRTWSGRRMKAPASPLSACHCVIHSPLDDNNIF